MRDLIRARADAVAVSIQAKYRLKAFLLRQGRRYPGRDGWTLAGCAPGVFTIDRRTWFQSITGLPDS